MQTELKQALNTILDVQNASGTNRKKELLMSWKDNQTLQDILYFVFNPYIRTGIGWSKLNKYNYQLIKPIETDTTIQDMFQYLIKNNTGTDFDIKYILSFIKQQVNPDEPVRSRFVCILQSIFTKNLKLGVSTTTFNKIWPGLIPGFGIQLACKWQDHIGELQGKTIYITEKLDGNRCFARVIDNEATLYSRSGRIIDGLYEIKEQLEELPNGWYDGELLGTNFNETQSIVRTKGKKENLVFNIFDMVSNPEVERQIGDVPYSLRRASLEKHIPKNSNALKLVPVIYKGKFNEEYVNSLLAEYTSKGSEGLMINLDQPYQFNRTTYLLKVKKMQTADLEVIDVTEGSGEFGGMTGALIVDYKGNKVGVGSGLEKEDRIRFWEHPEEIIGRIIEVQYFAETTNDDGSLSLRFPVFLRVREIDKGVSYE